MRKVIILFVVFSVLLGCACITGCHRIPDEMKGFVTYLESNVSSDVRCNRVNVVETDTISQKRIFIDLVNVNSIDEVDEIIELSNRYYDEHPEDGTMRECHVEIRMSSVKENYSRNFVCSNSDGMISSSDDSDIVLDTDDYFTALIISPTTMNMSLSDLRGHFDEIEYLYLDEIHFDDLGVFEEMDSLERLVIGSDVNGDEKYNLIELYPNIEVDIT